MVFIARPTKQGRGDGKGRVRPVSKPLGRKKIVNFEPKSQKEEHLTCSIFKRSIHLIEVFLQNQRGKISLGAIWEISRSRICLRRISIGEM